MLPGTLFRPERRSEALYGTGFPAGPRSRKAGKSGCFLLSGLFCCLGFSGVYFFAVRAGSYCIFCCLGGGVGPAQTKKNKKKHTAQTAKQKKNDPSDRFFCLLFGRVSVFFVLFGRGAFFFAVWAGCRSFFFFAWASRFCFFAVWAGVVVVFCCLGGVRAFFCCLGGGREFTHLPVSALLVFKGPNNKKGDQTAKKNKKHGFPEKRLQANRTPKTSLQAVPRSR